MRDFPFKSGILKEKMCDFRVKGSIFEEKTRDIYLKIGILWKMRDFARENVCFWG